MPDRFAPRRSGAQGVCDVLQGGGVKVRGAGSDQSGPAGPQYGDQGAGVRRDQGAGVRREQGAGVRRAQVAGAAGASGGPAGPRDGERGALRGSGRPGAILLMVLALIVLSAFVVERFLESALRQMHTEAVGSPALDLRLAASSALQVTLAAISELNELDGGLYGTVQGWGDPLAYAGDIAFGNGVSVQVQISDEGGRIGLNPPDRNQLLLLLTQMDVSQWEHDALIDSLIDWIDTDDDALANGAEDDYYTRIGSPRLPPNEPLRSYEDFRYIKGWGELLFDTQGRPNAHYALLAQTTSLRQSGGNSVNLNTAPLAVRYLLSEQAGLDARKLEEYIAGDDRLYGTADDVVIRNAGELGLAAVTAPDGVGFTPGLLRVRVEASRGASRLLLSVLLQPAATAAGGAGTQSGGGQGGGGSGGGQGGPGGGSSQGGGGAQGGGGGAGSGQGGGGNRGGSSAQSEAGSIGTFGSFTLIEYAENMVIE